MSMNSGWNKWETGRDSWCWYKGSDKESKGTFEQKEKKETDSGEQKQYKTPMRSRRLASEAKMAMRCEPDRELYPSGVAWLGVHSTGGEAARARLAAPEGYYLQQPPR